MTSFRRFGEQTKDFLLRHGSAAFLECAGFVIPTIRLGIHWGILLWRACEFKRFPIEFADVHRIFSRVRTAPGGSQK
ncbi:hypothetical protein D3C85_1294410 [compost metagenome]